MGKISNKNDKPIYETPVIIPLGELVRGSGANCGTGSSPGDSKCGAGGIATGGKCQPGSSAGTKCQSGSVASTQCSSGGNR